MKKTWDEILQEDNEITTIIDSDVITLATNLDSAFNTKYGVTTKVATALTDIANDYLKPSNSENARGLWEDLPIFLSNYKLKDRRPSIQIKDNLIRYLRFLTKMITDEGLQRKMVVNRNFNNSNTSNNTDKNVYSETPQLEIQTFEEAISYASNVSRNDNSGSSTQAGTSGETATNVNWEESLKNLQFAFYNEIIAYIVSLPSELYNYYALDSRPITELVVARRKALCDLYRML